MKALQVGLIGCGTVGTGVLRILNGNTANIEARLGMPVEVRHIVVSDLSKDRDPMVPTDKLIDDVDVLLNDPDVQVIIEVIGGLEPAKTIIEKAIDAKKHVVTANKALLAHEGVALFERAAKNGVDIYFEASVAGGIPIIRSLREALASDRIEALYGIVNGTSNYILTALSEEETTYEEVVKRAQDLGYAEADPSMDVDGIDAAQKLSILLALGFGAQIPYTEMYREGLSHLTPLDFFFAAEFGFAIKPLASAKTRDDGVEVSVQPMLIPASSLLSTVDGVFNAIYLESKALGPAMFYGQGAGMLPTAMSVVSDLIEVGRNVHQGTTGRIHEWTTPSAQAPTHHPAEETANEFYLRFTVTDAPGVLAKLAGILGNEGISIRQMVQTESDAAQQASIIILTHEAPLGALKKALAEIDGLSITNDRTQVIPIADI